MNPNRILMLSAVAAVALAAPFGAHAAANDLDEVLVENAYARVTRKDFEADLLRVPAASRAAFRADEKRVLALVNNLLMIRSFAAKAHAEGIDRDPLVATRMTMDADRVLFQTKLAMIEDAARAELDAKSAKDLDAIARETYLADKARYRKPAEVSASVILIDTKKRDRDSALALARDVRARLQAGASFDTVAREVSDAPSAKTDAGALGWFTEDKMDPALSKAAFALTNVGDFSEPVASDAGYLIVRLDGRRPAETIPYEQVKGAIIKDMKERLVTDRRERALREISHDPNMKINKEAINSLVNRIDQTPPKAPAAKPKS